MKHATSKNKIAIIPKAKKPNQNGAAQKMKLAGAKRIASAALKFGKESVVEKVKPNGKAKPQTLEKNPRQKIVKTASNGSAKKIKNLQTEKSVSVRQSKFAAKKSNRVVSKSNVTAKKTAAKVSAKKAKSQPQKTKLVSAKKTVKPAVEKSNPTAARIVKNETLKSKPKVSTKKPKKHNAKIVVKATKTEKPKVKKAVSVRQNKSVKKQNESVKKTVKPTTSAKKTNLAKAKISAKRIIKTRKKTEPILAVKKTQPKAKKASPKVAIEKIEPKNKWIKSDVSTKKAEPNKKKIKTVTPVAKTKSKVQNAKLTALPKAVNRAKKTVEKINSPPRKTLKKKKIKPLSSAVFRGKKDVYGFTVFSLKDEFEDVPAIFVISKRKTDPKGKAHHALVCIGQTDSVLSELKRHKKGKCVKKFEANAISVLPEANENRRLKIEMDLRAAHTIPCTQV